MFVRPVQLFLLFLILACQPLTLLAAEYQWSTTIASTVSRETGDHPRAFLWIPPDCKQVRATVIGQHNMEEEPVLEHPAFRKTMAELCFAEIWVTPPMGTNHSRFDSGTGAMLETLLAELAEQSGYRELAFAPLVPIGHSAMGSFGWDLAMWNPERVLAVLSINGIWPYFSDKNSPDWGDRGIDGIPGLTVKGEYEVRGSITKGWYASLKGDSLIRHPKTVFTQVVEPGGGHFEVSDEKIALMSLFLRKAAHYRLPAAVAATKPVKLRPIDPRREGWLYDTWRLDTPPSAPAAPVAAYLGNRNDAYWAFDAEMAQAIADFQGRFRAQAPVLIGYRQNEGMTAPRPDHAMVRLKFEPIEDGLSFKLKGGFWDQVPGDGKPSEKLGGKEGSGGWGDWLAQGTTTVNAGDPIPHPDHGQASRMRITRICGPVLQTAPDTFAIRFNRVGMNNPKRSNDIWLALTWPGDGQFKQMVQQAQLRIPLTNTQGQAQSIAFPDIPDQLARAAIAPIQLNAVSSAKVPVYYYVREGPAEVSDQGVLTFTPIPPRSKYPIKVTVVAWQWGRTVEPKLQSAKPVETSFSITRPEG